MLEKSQIESLLPHGGAMFLLDRVIRFDRNEIECSATSHRDPSNPLRQGNRLPVHTGIEYAAQAAGIHGGLLNRELHPEAPAQMGYLAVVSQVQWQVARLDDLPDELHIHARRTAVTAGGRAYRATIHHRRQLIMTGDLVIALEIGDRDAV